MTYSETWHTARTRRAERRAADPRVQARREGHLRRAEADRRAAARRAERAAHVDTALAQHLDGAA